MSAIYEGDAPAANEVVATLLPYDYIKELQRPMQAALFNPQTDELAAGRLLQLRETWRQIGTTTVFTSGVYDLMHLDHAGYLLHTKALGAEIQYERHMRVGDAEPWSELSLERQQHITTWLLGNNLLKLIVSVDGDASVAARKGAKGGAPRPIYAWPTRALMVAGQSFVNPVQTAAGPGLLPTVDAVTIHGPDDFEPEHAHASHFSLVERLQPDVWVIFGESQDIIDEAPHIAGLGSVALRCINDGEGPHYYEDPVIGKMNTTSILKRILGTEA